MSDSVVHPSHYNTGKFEVIDVIEDWNLGFNLGNTVKYIGRAGKKDANKHLEDLQKARWYLDREIARLEKVSSPEEKTTNDDFYTLSPGETITLSSVDAKVFLDNCFMKKEYKPSGAV